ncbi:MAG: 50S ribosomal protein L21 [Candidatus Jorgensenbacteria bacterium]|nr:50S ribosomal protein L21 [Candidatus Jorgensenbacteria bacterium]
MFAVIETGGKQYKVAKGDTIQIERLDGADGSPAQAGAQISFGQVLLKADGSSVEVGAPFIAGASVDGTMVKQGRGDKKIIFKFHSKTRHMRKKGHRQDYSEVKITEIK